MRTKLLYRMASGVCGVCLCYGLAAQALNGNPSADALSETGPAWEQVQNLEPISLSSFPGSAYGETSVQQPMSAPSLRRGKRHEMHGRESSAQTEGSFAADPPAEETEEEKKRAAEENNNSGDDSSQQENGSGDPPTLSQFLSALRCGGCRHNCCLLSPRCMKGRSKAQSATAQYTQIYTTGG